MVAEQSKIANFQIQEFDPGYWIGVRGTIAHWFDICLLHCGPGFESRRRRRREMTKQIGSFAGTPVFRFHLLSLRVKVVRFKRKLAARFDPLIFGSNTDALDHRATVPCFVLNLFTNLLKGIKYCKVKNVEKI